MLFSCYLSGVFAHGFRAYSFLKLFCDVLMVLRHDGSAFCLSFECIFCGFMGEIIGVVGLMRRSDWSGFTGLWA